MIIIELGDKGLVCMLIVCREEEEKKRNEVCKEEEHLFILEFIVRRAGVPSELID